jgi:hypothetical protein
VDSLKGFMQQTVFTCDGCGAQKKEANHWFFATSVGGIFRLSAWNSSGIEDSGDESHYCGEKCVLKAVSEFLGSQTN